MNNVDHNYQFILWQQLVVQAQELALKMPEMGLNPDDMPMLPLEKLRGILAFLRRVSEENKA